MWNSEHSMNITGAVSVILMGLVSICADELKAHNSLMILYRGGQYILRTRHLLRTNIDKFGIIATYKQY